jgi:alpha-ketoglutarate-dependent taurine dioxygenase
MLSPLAALPLVIEPATAPLDPIDWALGQRTLIESALRRYGAILFRNFDLQTARDFEAFAEAMSPGLYGQYSDLPKKEEGNNIYRSTPYPEQKMILFHNESSHLARWPGKQWFFCELPACSGGATPLVDVREIARRLPPEIAARFEQKSLLYIRTFTEGLDVQWRDFFKTADRAEVEAQCRASGTEFAWLEDEVLQTRTLCHAITRHPVTGERVFFNQIQLHHPSSLDPLDRQDLIDLLGADRLPRNVLYGDGTRIEDEVMTLIGELYEANAVRFPWRRGDVIMLDNMLTAHARDPYEGPRKIVVAMGAMTSRQKLQSATHEASSHR